MNKKRLLVLWIATIIGLSLQAQRVVTGSVKNKSDNSEVPSATVMIVGTTIGTKADADGNFKLMVPESMKGTFKLKASYIGLKNNIVSVAPGTDKVDFVMDEDRLKLDEVVVTALSIKREKRSLGYSTVSIKGDEINQAGASSALTGLQGKTTGATITNNGGTPGSSTSILLRGPSSFTGNNQALIVVDGVPINNSSLQTSDNLNNSVDFGNRLNDINPNDIESMTILKGAEGAAIYGSLAANGVVIITTKSAKKGTKKGRDYSITVNSDFKFQNPLMLPELQTQFGQGGNGHYDSRENWSWGAKLDGIVSPWGNAVMLPDANGKLVSQKSKTFFCY
jgi:TonB-dependent SusC/RagA subfamily outer membrane receptor